MVEDTTSEATLPLDTAGMRLLRAREAKGLSRAEVCAITKIPERYLAALETGDFSVFPARAYSVGFSRTYARAVGLDERVIVEEVRGELAAQDAPVQPRTLQSFEPGDPARVPSGRMAWLSLAAAVLVIVAGFTFWRGYYAPAGELPSLLPDETARAAPPAPTVAANAQPSGAVVFKSLEPLVWVKLVDGVGNQLLQKELTQGETFTVPLDQADVRLTTARPQALDITIGGQPVPRLAEVQTTLREVPVTAAALLARGTAPLPAATASAVPTPSPTQRAANRPARERPRATSSASTVAPQPRPAASTPAAVPSPNAAPAPAVTPAPSATPADS